MQKTRMSLIVTPESEHVDPGLIADLLENWTLIAECVEAKVQFRGEEFIAWSLYISSRDAYLLAKAEILTKADLLEDVLSHKAGVRGSSTSLRVTRSSDHIKICCDHFETVRGVKSLDETAEEIARELSPDHALSA